jgi:hypothetical protein
MPRRDEIGFEHEGIGAVLAHNRLAVPLNQREYSWEDGHVRELFNDFANAIANRKGTYFLGTIVLTRSEGDIPEVSDGQQRLATTTILLAAIRDYFLKNKDSKRAASIEQEFLKTTDRRTTEIVPRLKLNVDDHEFFTKAVISAPDSRERQKTEPKKASHLRIKAARELAAEHIQNVLEPYNKSVRTERLLDWVNFIESGAEVILLRVPDHLSAFQMFETLNDRGLKASQADLIKNYLLSFCAPDKIRDGQQKWAQMLGTLESVGRGDLTVTYLHHLLITKHGPTKEREVFDKVRSQVNSRAGTMEFLEELADGATDYAALFNSDHKKWNEYGTTTRKNLSTINRDLRVEQIRPLMFAVSKHFSVREARLSFRLFVSWSVRILIVGTRGGLLDRNYAVCAQEISSKRIGSAKELVIKLADVIPADPLFETAFAEARVSKEHLARYYLRALELKRKGDPEPEFVPMDEENIINLEHVLPENPENKWNGINDETANAYYRRLGNLVILQAKKNFAIGNGSFNDKKKTLKESAFLLTSDVARNSSWGVAEITARQKQLAKLALQTWPLTY